MTRNSEFNEAHSASRVNRVYNAESNWQKNTHVAGKSLNIFEANKVMGQMIDSPKLDSVEGIDKIRASKRQRVVFKLPGISKLSGGKDVVTDKWGNTIFDSKAEINAGKLTHELTHKLVGFEAGHGNQFTSTHHKIVAATLGTSAADRLEAAYNPSNLGRQFPKKDAV